MAGSVERSQAYLRDLAELPPVHRGPARPPRKRPDLFSPAMRQVARPRGKPFERLIAGEFQVRLVALLVATVLAIVVITVLT